MKLRVVEQVINRLLTFSLILFSNNVDFKQFISFEKDSIEASSRRGTGTFSLLESSCIGKPNPRMRSVAKLSASSPPTISKFVITTKIFRVKINRIVNSLIWLILYFTRQITNNFLVNESYPLEYGYDEAVWLNKFRLGVLFQKLVI